MINKLRSVRYDQKLNIAWLGRFPDMGAIETVKRGMPSDSAFRREYMLEDVPEGEPVIQPGWIQYYDDAPNYRSYAAEAVLISVDLAISDKTSADCTAIVPAALFGEDEKQRIFILPMIVNERMDSTETIERIKRMCRIIGNNAKVLIEDVSFQRAYYQSLARSGYRAALVQPHGSKRERLTLTTPMLQSGKILFPRHGAETLIAQLVGFGSEKHDDLADAFSQLVIHCIMNERGRARSGRRD